MQKLKKIINQPTSTAVISKFNHKQVISVEQYKVHAITQTFFKWYVIPITIVSFTSQLSTCLSAQIREHSYLVLHLNVDPLLRHFQLYLQRSKIEIRLQQLFVMKPLLSASHDLGKRVIFNQNRLRKVDRTPCLVVKTQTMIISNDFKKDKTWNAVNIRWLSKLFRWQTFLVLY